MNENITVHTNQDKPHKSGARKFFLVVLLVFPTLLAIISFILVYNNLYFSPSNIYDITLYGPDGEIIDSERNFLRNAEKDGLVLLFSPITENFTDTTIFTVRKRLYTMWEAAPVQREIVTVHLKCAWQQEITYI